jgi:lysyl-tRNA synthetase class 1
MDAQALLTPDAVERLMGVPLSKIPDQEPDGHASYARHHAEAFIATFAGLGVHPDRYYWMSEHYEAGDMDPFIRQALDGAAVVRDLYRRIANVQHPDTWHPLSVICENCGRIGTTIVTGWDGERVHYQCRADLVTWAHGCGHDGWVSPFGGRAKLPWNVEWAAQWSLFGVTIEPCGKDLATAGGSRDRADAVAREVFEREPPIRVDYEFLNIGGKKMSTSKGHGAPAHKIVEVIPGEQLRLLFLRTRPNTAIEFEPNGTDAVPRLFDEFDRLAAATAGKPVKGELPPGFEAVFRYSLMDSAADVAREAAWFRPPFPHLALLEQIPGVDVVARVEAEKGSALEPREAEIVGERRRAARAWLETYAPPAARMEVRREGLPAEVTTLSSAQRALLGHLAEEAPPADAGGEAWQSAIFAAAADGGLPAGEAFKALYAAFLGRTSGPRAGWLLASLDREFVVARLREASGRGTLVA